VSDSILKLRRKEIKKIVERYTKYCRAFEGLKIYIRSEISGGMRKRVGFARAIAYNPKIISL